MEGLPGWGINSMMPAPPPRQHAMKDDTHHSRTHSFQQREYERTIMTAKWCSGNLWGKSYLTFVLQVRKNPGKISPRYSNLSRPGIEPGPVAWQARMLPPAPQRWTKNKVNQCKFFKFIYSIDILYFINGSSYPRVTIRDIALRKNSLNTLFIFLFFYSKT